MITRWNKAVSEGMRLTDSKAWRPLLHRGQSQVMMIMMIMVIMVIMVIMMIMVIMVIMVIIMIATPYLFKNNRGDFRSSSKAKV